MKPTSRPIALGSIIDDIVTESVKSALQRNALREKERRGGQAQNGGQVVSQGGSNNAVQANGGSPNPPPADDGVNQQPQQPSKTGTDGEDEAEKLKKGDITADDVVQKLNAIRSGKSFKDNAISAAMQEYVESLSKAEKTALLAYLKGIAQIVTGEVPGNDASQPDSPPADVNMQKGAGPSRSKHIEPNVIKAVPPKASPKSTEDTRGPVPITPKKR